MRLYLLEDEGRSRFEPFALTRPVGELLFGCETLRARAGRVLGAGEVQYLAPESLNGFKEPGAPGFCTDYRIQTPCHVLSSRFVLEAPITGRTPGSALDHTKALVTPDGRLVGWSVAAPDDLPDGWQELGGHYEGALPSLPVSGRLLETVWQLMAENADRITTDLRGAEPSRPESSSGTVYGDHPLHIAPDVVIGPHVVFDTRRGPIRVDSGVVIEPMTVLGGPCSIGANTTLLGGAIRESSIGPHCKIRGEVDTTVILGFSNKAHDGYLGHAVVGRWVNLGAMTTNSDLKNNYSSVRVDLGAGAGPVDTGERKIGVFLGDHVKTGIGTLLGTGTVLGAGSNIMAGPVPPRTVVPFSWGSGAQTVPYDVNRFVATTRIIMARRDQTLDDGMETLLRGAWQATHGGTV
jgi:UDP-N-acetylglucosamine diphosphorylase/glucosamine-1-phosphate N-acetyltransferase